MDPNPPGIPEPVRLRVSYKSADALLGEFTRSVSKGGVAIETRKSLPLGTKFIFELRAQGVEDPVEVVGEVVRVVESTPGRFIVNIRYDPAGDRRGLDGILKKIFDAHRNDAAREYPRLPIHLRATEEKAYSHAYVIRDVSMGGMGLEVEASQLPRTIQVGSPFLCEVWLSIGTLVLHGEVVWIWSPQPGKGKWVNPALGVNFGKLRPDSKQRLEKILTLRGLPVAPWRARISFGAEAIARMP